MSFDLTPINVKKADGTNAPMIAFNDGTNNAFAHAALDATGAVISPATSGLQTTANSTLSTIATQTSDVATGAKQDTGNASAATTATNTGTLSTNLGAKADAAVTNPASSGSMIALLKGILTGVNAAIAAGSNLIGKVGIDQTTPGATNLVYLPAPLVVAGNTTTRSANTTAYSAGQLVNAGTVVYPTIAAARANDMPGRIRRLKLKKSGTSLTNGVFRVHLYSSQPTATNADGGAFLTTIAGYLGSFDVTMSVAFSDGAMGIGVPTSGADVAFTPATGTANLYYLIEARAAYTPGSAEVFTPYVEVE